MPWTQLDFSFNTVARQNATDKAPPRAYVEAHANTAVEYAVRVGWARKAGVINIKTDTLEELYAWLYVHESSIHTAKSVDVWLADELAAGCVFVSADEVAHVLEK